MTRQQRRIQKPRLLNPESTGSASVSEMSIDDKSIFVVHGRNTAARDAMFAFLRSLNLRPIEWSQAVQLTGKPCPFIGEILHAAFTTAQAVVVLMTPDDIAVLDKKFHVKDDPDYEVKPTPQARPNVLFEAGLAIGRAPERTILVQLGKVRPFSDIAGIHIIRMNNSSQRRHDLADRLSSAGCAVDMSGRDWHFAGDFDTCIPHDTLPGESQLGLGVPDEVEAICMKLSAEAKTLLTAIAVGENGSVMRTTDYNGVTIITDRFRIDPEDSPRRRAKYEKALRDLISLKLLQPRDSEDTSYDITELGYDVADML